MENPTKFIKLACAGIIFCIAVFYFIYGINTYNKSVTTVREKIKEDEIIYQQYYSNKKDITYSELIAVLFQELEYDIEIDGLLISKNEHQAENIINYEIDVTDYSKSYVYNAGEKITRVVYEKIN